jgi:hypothetical protein
MKTENEVNFASEPCATPYGIERHSHLFAAWAASSAASVNGYRFPVEKGQAILEACGFKADFSKPEQLPVSEEMDEQHRQWRDSLIEEAADSQSLRFTHGVAAKLINCYLKSRFVCGGHHAHERVRSLHPPIDRVLLTALGRLNIGGCAKEWRKARQTGWSNFSSEQYEKVIALIRKYLKGEPLWKIEEHWKGNQ